MKKISLIFLGIILAFSCKKEKANMPDDCACVDPNAGKLRTLTFAKEGEQFTSPSFNPKNPNEFVFNHINYSSGKAQLSVYNMKTGITKILANDVQTHNQPKWSRKGWIAFDNVFNNMNEVWIVKDNGDSLTKISPSANSFFPVWDSSGNNVIWSFSPNLGYPYYILRKNLHSPHIDTIHNDYIGYNDVSRSNLLISEIAIGSDLFLGYSPLSAVSYTPIINLGYSTIRSISWHPNNEDFYYANYRVGIAKGNIFASTSQIILPNCGCVNYRIISCSPDGGKLVAERIESHFESDGNGGYTNTIFEYSFISIIDLATMKETKLCL